MTTTTNLADRVKAGTLTVEEIKAVDSDILNTQIDTLFKHTVLYNAMFGDDDNTIDVLRAILDRGVNINGLSCYGMTPLSNGARNRKWSKIRLLLSRGAQAHFIDTLYQRNALHWAAENGAPEDIIQGLICAGADYNGKDKNEKTPIELARKEHHIETATYIERYCSASTKSAFFLI
jgi:ankyrin repeat protein